MANRLLVLRSSSAESRLFLARLEASEVRALRRAFSADSSVGVRGL